MQMKDADRLQVHRRHALGAGAASVLSAAAWPAWAQAPAHASRVAVVVGNAAYPAAPLRNAVRDAQSMGAALGELGFQVVDVRDAGKAQMEAAIARAHELLKGQAGVGLFFYAGHAVQLDWRNFLLPVDARPATAQEVSRQAVDVQAAIEAFRSAGTRLNIVVLDACRDNPFDNAGGGKGLAPMDAPPGTYLAYATAPGNTADDGDEAAGNGLYTRFLLREIVQPQARIEDVFKRVRLQVRRASAGKQVPWDSTSLEEDFYFAQGQRVPAATERDRDAAFDEEKAHWDRVRTSARAEDFYTFLQRYPSGPMSELAQYRLDQLARPAVRAAQLRARAPNMLPSGADRFKVGDAFEYEWIDRLDGDRKTTFRHRVTSIDEHGRVFMNNGTTIVDQMGNVLRNPYGTRDPAAPTIPADLQVGKRWRASYWNERDGVRYRNYHDYHAASLEEFKSPLGEFMAYKVDGRGESATSTRINRMLSVRWIDPATMHEIHQDFRFVNPVGKTFEHKVLVMTRRWLVSRT